MLDVHPPHAPTHTWRDFLIHIATIVVGLIIAVGLEQTVEAVRDHRERVALRAALDRESRQVMRDCEVTDQYELAREEWLKQLQDKLSQAAENHPPPGDLPTAPRRAELDAPDVPIYATAKANGKLALLTEDEVVGYREIEGNIEALTLSEYRMAEIGDKLTNLSKELNFGRPKGEAPLSHATPLQLVELNRACVEFVTAIEYYRLWLRGAWGAAQALLHGERDLRRIENAEMNAHIPH